MKTSLVLLLVLFFADGAICRPLTNSSRGLVSDGVEEEENRFSSYNTIGYKGIMNSGSSSSGEETCEQMYGFLPCSKTIPGHLFLILVYEYLLFHAESYVASGGERIFKILGPGVFGASAFQVIGSLPEALILLASGLSSSDEIAQECVLTGVGLLAGSSILLLTIIWGTCIVLGSQSFSSHLHSNLSGNKKYNPLERLLFSLWPGHGVVTDLGTSYTSRIMLLSVIPLVMIQIPRIFSLSYAPGEGIFVLITLVVSIMFLLCYFFYQVLKPWIQKKREEREMMKHLIPDVLEHLQDSVYGSLLAEDGTPDVPAIKRLFKDIDLDKDDCISYFELKELMTNIKFGIIPYDADVAASKIMEELDISGDQLIDEEEFVTGLSRWLNTARNQSPNSDESEEDDYQKTWEQTDKLVEDKFIDKSPLAWTKAITLLVLGIIMLGVLAEPLIQSVHDFSKAARIPSFYVAFIFVPLATTARLSVSAINEARRKKLHTTSLTLSEIYGTVFMNNILGLAVLLSLIYFRGLSWNFSAEVLMVLLVSAIIGFLASFNTVFPVWTSILAYMLYPLSLILVYILGDSDWLS
ncbi:UNVERIFIED_CONTAM: Sodium/calcium exchanger NCL1 [Sesamum latifolium]|uniref:Sodium/calcium exchanger NCL1 n=1 Tax=Sesamum latifolium TaxID=2727402 RepID=A0AAW2WP66_9LAMI